MRSAGVTRPTAAMASITVALATLFVLACHDSPSEPRGEVTFQSVAKAVVTPRSGPPIRTVVRDDPSWEATWLGLWGEGAPARPAIDFNREMVIVATASLSCGSDVDIESLERAAGSLVVRLADAGPNPLCLCFAPEYAFHVVRAARVDGPVDFVVRTSEPRCG